MSYNKKLYKLMLDDFERLLIKKLSSRWNVSGANTLIQGDNRFKYHTKFNIEEVRSEIVVDLPVYLWYNKRRLLRIYIDDKVYFCISKEHLSANFSDGDNLELAFRHSVVQFIRDNFRGCDYWGTIENGVRIGTAWVRDIFEKDNVLQYYQNHFQICRVDNFFKDVIDKNIIPIVCFDFSNGEVSFIAKKSRGSGGILRKIGLDDFASSPYAYCVREIFLTIHGLMCLENEVVYKETAVVDKVYLGEIEYNFYR
jgi:hypothetical protein